jgi:crossover junction endodeoxyribonuclease RusA
MAVISEPRSMIRFTVAGRPVPQGSMTARVTNYGTPYLKANNREALGLWRHAINDECRNALAGQVPFAGPVEVTLVFYIPRPKGDYTGKGALKKGAPLRPTARNGDLDKYIRAALDAMTGVAFLDDSQVVTIEASKHFTTEHIPQGVAVTIFGEELS